MEDVEFEGNEAIDGDDLREAIATRENPEFLGVAEGVVYDFSLLNRYVLERDVARLERYYRARGYYQARVRAARIHRISDDEVVVTVVVDEGPVVRTQRVELTGDEQLDPELRARLDETLRASLPLDEPFEEERFEQTEAALARELHDAGHAWAEVERSARVDVVAHRASGHFRVAPGPVAEIGEVTIERLGELPEDQVREVLDLEPGAPYSRDALEEAQQAAMDLGVFSSIRLEPQLGDGPNEARQVPIQVTANQARHRMVELGGGVELDAIEADVHLRAAWQSRNFLGGLRRFRVEAVPGVTLYPLRINHWVAPDQPLPKGRLRTDLVQPGMFEARTEGTVGASFNVYPVLLDTEPNPEDPVIGYLETRGHVGLQRRFWKLRTALKQHVQYALPFAYAGQLDERLSDIVLGYPELAAHLDLRDDPVEPHLGLYAGGALQGAVFGDGHDVKVVPEIRGYLPLGRPLTLALKARWGFLFPFDYGNTIGAQLANPGATRSAEDVRDLQLLYFRGLFAGGPSSNRGYPPRTIAPHAVVPFLNPRTEAAQVECARDDPSIDPSQCGVPIGGRTLWGLSAELRFPIYGPLRSATFCDAADVAPGQAKLRFGHLHLSCGLGFRYRTPVGPIRLDAAYRIPGAQVLGGGPSAIEGDPGTIFGAPINISFGIGEAF